MTDVTPNDFSRSPVERMAQRLLAEARACPLLIERDCHDVALPTEPRWELPRLDAIPNLTLLSDPSLDVREYLEELVSIAAGSAQQAENVSLRSHEASRKMRGGMPAMVAFGAVGLLVGVIGFAAAHSANIELAAMRQQVSALDEMQRQTHDELSEFAAKSATQCDTSEAAERADTPAPQARPAVAAPMQIVERPVIRYSEVWPDSRPPLPHRAAPVRSHVVVPMFVAQLQRNISALFR